MRTRQDYLSLASLSGLSTGLNGPRGAGKGLYSCELSMLHHSTPGRAAHGERYQDYYACQSPFCPECEEKKRYAGIIREWKAKIGLLQHLVELETGRKPEVVTITFTPPGNQSVWWRILGCNELRGKKTDPWDRARWMRILRGALASSLDGYVRYPSKKNPHGGAYSALREEFRDADKPYKSVWDTEHVLWNAAIKEVRKLTKEAVEQGVRDSLYLDKECRVGQVLAYDPMSELGIYHHVHVVLVCAYIDGEGKWKTFDPDKINVDQLGASWKRVNTGAVLGPLGNHGLVEHVATAGKRSRLSISRESYPVSEAIPVWSGSHAHVRRDSTMEGAVNYALKSPLTEFYRKFLKGEVELPPDHQVKDSRIGKALNVYHRLIALAKPRPRMVSSAGFLSPRMFSQYVHQLCQRHYPTVAAGVKDWKTVRHGIESAEEEYFLLWWGFQRRGGSRRGDPIIEMDLEERESLVLDETGSEET